MRLVRVSSYDWGVLNIIFFIAYFFLLVSLFIVICGFTSYAIRKLMLRAGFLFGRKVRALIAIPA